MSDPAKTYDEAHALVVTLLNQQAVRTPKVIRDAVGRIASLFPADAFDQAALVARLMHEGNVHVPDATMMVDPSKHEEWLPYRRGKIEWRFWRRYETYLEQEKKFPHIVVQAVGKLTDDILGQLEDPQRKPDWDCRGMVVGSVQSGKTANYCGLVCKAIDAGYRLVVVLAGLHKNLRSQTQFRIDEGVLGCDSQKDRRLDRSDSLIGVGKLFGERLPVNYLTTSADNGDFNAARADTGVFVGSDPVVLVVKKNSSVLKNLLAWVLHVGGEDIPGENRRVVRGVPLLVIDDEADNASINTKDKNEDGETVDVTAINGRIRELLDAFEKSAYVGYTATPFANIFINPEAETPKHGEDLFPRSFILNVSPPSTYISPSRIFGLDGDPDAGIEPREGLPLVRIVDDHEEVFPPKHKKDLIVHDLPESLTEAIHCFVLTCAARRARGQSAVHNSMLVHVTRFVDVQHQVAQLVQQHVDAIRRRLAIGEGERRNTLVARLQRLWRESFEPVSAAVRGLSSDESLSLLSWDQVAAELVEAAARIEVKEINGHATDFLDYVTHRQGFSVIAVGGDKLSRGLTLEGLSISYFLRSSRMYDTLMQMGRWFGYRPGYLDLCRLYTTDELRKWYCHIALAEVELRREFDRMKAAGLTPRRYGLRVREHPGGLLVTALNKMAHGRTQRLSYAGQLLQTAHFSTDFETVRSNRSVVDKFLLSLGGRAAATEAKTGDGPRAAWLWRNVPAAQVIQDLLTNFSCAAEGWRLQKPELIEFIKRQADNGEIAIWTVALVNTRGDGPQTTLAECVVGVAERTPEKDTWKEGEIPKVYATRNANIQSPSHQALDLAEMTLDEPTLAQLLDKRADEGGQALFGPEETELLRGLVGHKIAEAAERLTTFRNPSDKDTRFGTRINGLVARQLRPKTHGLLLIYPLVPRDVKDWPSEKPFMGLAFSFPTSHTARAVNYKVNRVWQATFRDDDFED